MWRKYVEITELYILSEHCRRKLSSTSATAHYPGNAIRLVAQCELNWCVKLGLLLGAVGRKFSYCYQCWCRWNVKRNPQILTYTHPCLTALYPGLPGWAGTRKVKPIWTSLKQETVSGSGISWAICMSAPRSRQITTPAPQRSVFYRTDALPATQPTVSKHWRTFKY